LTGERPSLPRRAAAEGIGTFALVFVGCGAIVTDSQRHGALGAVGVGLCFFAYEFIRGEHPMPAPGTRVETPDGDRPVRLPA
jgi:hypothetical protein